MRKTRSNGGQIVPTDRAGDGPAFGVGIGGGLGTCWAAGTTRIPPAALAAPTVSIFALAAAYLHPQLEADDGGTS